MEKLKMHTEDCAELNIQKIGQLFPNCLTERLDENGKPEIAIDFDKLKNFEQIFNAYSKDTIRKIL